MADTTLPGVLLKGVAASRPAANAVAKGTIYSATDTGAITQSDASSWSAYATISSGLSDPMTTRGDIIIRNSSNTTARLGRGSASTVLTSDGTDVSWQAAGGGGSDLVQTSSGAGSVYIPGLRGSADVKPASPSAFDDEFEALSGWTTLGTLDTSNVTDVPSHWHVKRVNAGVAVDGIYKTAPSMPFTVTAKLADSNLFISANYNHAAILLTESSPGKLCTVGLVTNTSVQYVSTYRWTNRTTLATNVDTSTGRDSHYPIWRYLRVVVTSSSSISVYISDNGLYWWPVGSQQAITTGLTVANVGLAIGDAAAAGTVEAWFDWIRFS